MNEAAAYGAPIERGQVIVAFEDGRVQIESFSRPGIITPPLAATEGLELMIDDLVYYVLFGDGSGLVLARTPDNAGVDD